MCQRQPKAAGHVDARSEESQRLLGLPQSKALRAT